jgi:DNA helicase HerA-like ATPase
MAPDDCDPAPPVGLVIGTEDATPLEYWVAVAEDQYLQLDDVVALERTLPDGRRVELYGMVEQVRARHEGAQYDSDVFLIEEGVLPAQVSQAAKVATTRVEPEVFVPPLPGAPVRKATGDERARALLFDEMERKLPAGLSRDDEPFFLDLDFLDGSRGAHVNISGVSGVATKTTYATFLLYSLFHSGRLGAATANTKALVFNVKGEDLLFLDHRNARLDDAQRDRYGALGLQPGAFRSVGIVAPPRPGDANATPQVGSRATGVAPFFWTLEEFCRQRLLPFLFADAEDDRQQYTMVVHNVARRLEEATPSGHGGVVVDGESCRTFRDLVEVVDARLNDDDLASEWAGRAIGGGSIGAFVRRLFGAVDHVEHLIRGDVERRSAKPVDLDANQVTVVDIHNLNDRAKRFVVGVVLRQAFQAKEASGTAEPLQFVVLDELNKYAPREGTSPIKELLLDIAERGRSLGIILIGAQQTASEVERRVVANSAIRVVGRLDSAEASRGEYGWLPQVQRQRSTIIKPGTMIVSQPQLPVPVVIEFPFPAWATRVSETGGTEHAPRRPPPATDEELFDL